MRSYFVIVVYILIICTYICASQDISPLLINKIKLPDSSFTRIKSEEGSYTSWLRNLPLKPHGSAVMDYRGYVYKKGTDSTVAAVTDWNIKGKRLEQCMDILVRFYAEYLWKSKQTEKIVFPLPGGYQLRWSEWQQGVRPHFKGINIHFRRSAEPDSSRACFEKYLRTLFAESHTQQFYHAYDAVTRHDVQIGDFIVKKGSKSHAVMIVDMAYNDKGDTIALIGHGDTPACQFYLLNYKKDNPWFPLDFKQEKLPLPIRREMTWDGLRRFPNE